MCISEPVIPVMIVDGQPVYVPGYETWTELSQTRWFQGKRIFGEDYADLVAEHLSLVRRYPEFSLGFRELPAFGNDWVILMLLKTHAGPQRVAIEWVTCEVCGWYGVIANPMSWDVYVGAADIPAGLERASKLPVVTCPKCKSDLPRHAVWAEPRMNADKI